MRAFFATFWMGFQYLWRNPVNVAILIAFPIAIIFILGNALASYITVDVELDPVPVAAYADPGGSFAAFLQSEEIARFLDVTFTGEAEAEALVRDEAVCAAFLERDGELSVLRIPGGGIETGLALSMADSYRQIGAAAMLAALDSSRFADTEALLALDVRTQDMPLGKRVPRAVDYYAVTMLVMILLYTGLNGLELFGKSFLGETGGRVRLAPISAPALAGGLLAASTVTSFLQGMVTFVFTGAVYGVYWGQRLPLVLLTLLGVVVFSQSLCIFLVMLTRHNGLVTGASQAIFWTLTFVSKGYAKITFGPADKIFAYTPNSLAHTVVFGAVYGGNESKMMFDLALLFGMSAALFIPAFLLGRRRLK